MDPITREEQFLNAAVNSASGQATGDLPEPITREEKYLKGLVDALENGGGGGSGGLKVFALEEYQDVPCKITGDIDVYDAFLINTDRVGLCIVRLSGNNYFATVICDGYIQHLDLIKIQDGEYYFGVTAHGDPVNPLNIMAASVVDELKENYLRVPDADSGTKAGDVATLYELNGQWYVQWEKKDTIEEVSITGAIDQLILAIKALADAQTGTAVTKYLALSGAMSVGVMGLVNMARTALASKAIPIVELNGSQWVFDGGDFSASDVAAMVMSVKFKEFDFTNNKIYDYLLVGRSDKAFIQCTCFEATSLM